MKWAKRRLSSDAKTKNTEKLLKTSRLERAAAEFRVAEREDELVRLQAQIEEREKAIPLRERVKEIVKKYGVTVTAILLAARVTIGTVIGAITNSLKALGKGMGNGLKVIGKKKQRPYLRD